MNTTNHPNQAQAVLWNGIAGHAWVDQQILLDRMFKPMERLLAESAAAALSITGPTARVLDVGSGTGSTTLAVARLLGAKGHYVGLDISQPMITAARRRAASEKASASFIRADAQTYTFQPASFDLVISRFGVMFFDDPVRAFANLRQAATRDAKLRFIAWRSPAENAFMTTAERAAAPLLANLPARLPDAPGQFAFADQRRTLRLLEQSGWGDIDIRPIDVACTLLESELVPYLTRFGLLGRILHADKQTRTRVIDAVRTAFDPYVHGVEVRFNAACWMVGASASSSAAIF